MTGTNAGFTQSYQPERTDVPPLFTWPPRPGAAFRWLIIDLMLPWGLFWIALAVLVWYYLTPPMDAMVTLSLDWMALIWLRNAALLTVIAGGLHWWFYVRRGQDMDTKFTRRWLARDDDRFLWGNQTRDNMFWSLVSGVTIWTAYESLTWWRYANGHVAWPTFAEAPLYLLLMTWGVFFWSTGHFYLVHRAMHWQPLYVVAHELHHRNASTGPWSGISMHPVEHLIYFSLFLLWWVVPAHPVLIILTGLFQGISPAVSHSGFDYLKIGNRFRIPAGDNFHNLHHRFFHINYGNSMTPLDAVFGSWHDGGDSGKRVLKQRLRGRTA